MCSKSRNFPLSQSHLIYKELDPKVKNNHNFFWGVVFIVTKTKIKFLKMVKPRTLIFLGCEKVFTYALSSTFPKGKKGLRKGINRKVSNSTSGCYVGLCGPTIPPMHHHPLETHYHIMIHCG
jgi:hypothetical protein